MPENPFICCIYPRRLRPRPSESGVSSVTRWIEVRMRKQQRILFVDTRKVFELRYRRSSRRMVLSSPPPVAFELISEQRFEVLIADLNIGSPGDGFTIVSAMRRTQPEAVTLILTGYPAFETALEAIRRQVDEYLTKPTDIDLLVTTIRSSRRPDQAGAFDPDATPAGYHRRQPELDHRALAGCVQERCRDQFSSTLGPRAHRPYPAAGEPGKGADKRESCRSRPSSPTAWNHAPGPGRHLTVDQSRCRLLEKVIANVSRKTCWR